MEHRRKVEINSKFQSKSSSFDIIVESIEGMCISVHLRVDLVFKIVQWYVGVKL